MLYLSIKDLLIEMRIAPGFISSNDIFGREGGCKYCAEPNLAQRQAEGESTALNLKYRWRCWIRRRHA